MNVYQLQRHTHFAASHTSLPPSQAAGRTNISIHTHLSVKLTAASSHLVKWLHSHLPVSLVIRAHRGTFPRRSGSIWPLVLSASRRSVTTSDTSTLSCLIQSNPVANWPLYRPQFPQSLFWLTWSHTHISISTPHPVTSHYALAPMAAALLVVDICAVSFSSSCCE